MGNERHVGGVVILGADRWQLGRLAAREIGRDVAASLRRLGRVRLGPAMPSRLLFAPQDLRTTDAAVAHEIYGGYFVFAGRAVQTAGASPFAVNPPSSAWSEALYGFGWLRHLRAADTPLARDNARALLSEAVGIRNRPPHPEARAIRVVSRRLISLLCQSPLLLTGADHHFYRRLMRSIALAVQDLERGAARASRPLDRLSAAIGLCYAGLCCEGYEAKLRRAMRALAGELDAQILPDGGHVGRNPGTLIDLLLDLIPLRQIFTSRGLEPPEALDQTIARMLPMLRLFRHGDGSLALFNGMGRAPLDQLATIVSYDDVRGEPAQHATYSGYDRVEAGPTILIADLGRAPPLPASADAHAGCLSFELSSGFDRIVVNCGAPALEGGLRQAARGTSAHSTLALDGLSSARFLETSEGRHPLVGLAAWLSRRLGAVILAGPRHVDAERKTEPDGSVLLVGRHDGYLARSGYRHERRLRLSPDGTRLSGADRLIAAAADGRAPKPDPRTKSDAMLRFHLHPSVAAQVAEDGASVLLRTGREGGPVAFWRFTMRPDAQGEDGAVPVSGRVLTLEDSIFFADADGRRPTKQIVVMLGLTGAGEPAPLSWRFERLTP